MVPGESDSLSNLGYDGQVAIIPLGTAGLYTDAPQVNIPPTNLILANNVTYYNGVLQKDFGSVRWNQIWMGAGIRRFGEMFPDNQGRNQRIYMVLENGEIWRLPNNYTNELVTPEGDAPELVNPNNYVTMMLGGNELQNFPKKLFIFTGYDPVQVISGEEITRSNIALPPADWSGTNQPFWGLLHRSRPFAGGCPKDPHRVYVASATDHEDYTSNPLSFEVFPGEGDTIVGGAVFRGRLFLFKYPVGVYYLVDDDVDPTNWYFTKFGAEFGACSPQSFGISNDDLLVANNYGGLTSMAAALVFGDINSSDVFHQLGVRRYTENQIRPDVIFNRDMIFYGYKRQYYCSFQSFMHSYPDRILSMDVRDKNSPAKIAFSDKDQPNCLGLLRDSLRIPRPFYGSRDGFLYQMDNPNRWVGANSGDPATAYEMDAQTPHMDFSQGNAIIGQQVKLFDFIQLEYEPTGDWDVTITVYIDSRVMGDYQVNLKSRSNLGEFPLTNSVVDGEVGFSDRIPIYGEGKRISLRFRQSGLGEDVRIVRAYVFYRLSAQQQTIG